MVGSVGPLATVSREPGQVRKEAAVAVVLCAGVWLAESASITKYLASPMAQHPPPCLLSENATQIFR